MNLPEPHNFAFMLTSIIGALFAILSISTNRSNKIIEFRQTWVKDHKQISADFISHAHDYFLYKRNYYRGNLEDKSEIFARADRINKVRAKAVISLNQKEKHVIKMKSLENRIFDNVRVDNKEHILGMEAFKEHRILTKTYGKIANIYYKKEWERVKKGELSYRVTYFFCFVFFFLIIGFTVFYSLFYYYDKDFLNILFKKYMFKFFGSL